MKYLITGGCGFLGSNIAHKILNNNGHVTIFDNLSRIGSIANLDWLKSSGNLNFIHGDIRNQSDVMKMIIHERPDIIFHLAGQVAMTTSIDNPQIDFETNAVGTFNLLESVRKYSPESSIIYSSTNKVYGDLEYFKYEESKMRYICSEFPNGFPEDINLDFHSPYGCSKGAADQYVLDYHRIFNIKTIVFRHSSMFGGRQFSTEDQGWIGWFCKKALDTKYSKGTNNKFTISGNGKQVRDVLYSTDMVDLYLRAAANIDKAQGQAFNIGGGIENSLSLLELFDFLQAELGIGLNYELTKPRESDQKVFVANISKAKKYFNWEPSISKEEGLRKMLLWVENNA